jgi:hypothetical protein
MRVRSWSSDCVRALFALRCTTFSTRRHSTGPVVGLGSGGGLAGQHRPGCGDRVHDVGLAVPAPDLTVRAADFQHRTPCSVR